MHQNIVQPLELQERRFPLQLYLIDTALNLDFKDSENDWRSDGPALSWVGDEVWLEVLLQRKWLTIIQVYKPMDS